MRLTSRRLRRLKFSVGVITPAALLLVLTGAAVLAFVLWSTADIDRRELDRESSLVALAIERQIAEVPRAQESVAIWDDAIDYTQKHYDKAWLDNNLGVWMHDYFGFDAVAVLSNENTPIYTMAAGQSPAADTFSAAWSALAPLVAQMRSQIAAGALGTYADQGGVYPRVIDIRSFDGQPAVISVLPITSQTGRIVQPRGAEYLHVAVDYLDDAFARKLAAAYEFENPRFTSATSRADDLASYPLFAKSGRAAVVFEWKPSRPGTQMLAQTGPALVVAYLIAIVLVLFLVRRLWVSSAALDAERLDARHQAFHDPLTTLPNRAAFVQELDRLLRRSKRNTVVSLIMLDLDRFKQVNDTLGHGAGDDLICAVGQRLLELVGAGDTLARLGGDEFAVIHHGYPGKPEASALAAQIVDAIAKPFDVAGSEAFVGASVGVAIAGRDDRDQRELTRKADIALYEAKARGRNRVIVYAEEMSAQLQDRHTIEAELRDALRRNDQLSVAFQPLYAARTGDIAGAEALVRWNHPRLGPISPARFVPVAETVGLIEQLGAMVLRQAMELGARWPGKRIAVNISPAQLRSPRFADQVFGLLEETGMRSVDLELEITEGILLDPRSAAVENLTTLRKAGIRIALDDFGTGYSSLAYLKRYPVDCIKIDRSFVAQLGPRSSSVAIVQAMVSLAHALQIEVTAEGVETHDQMTILKSMGCNTFQGFVLSPPVSLDVVEGKFRRSDERRKPGIAQVA